MSIFSYSITRQYPYRWFTPTAVVGGIALAAVFSTINFFSNAYNMVTVTTFNPDIVEANRWSGHVPNALTSRIQPRCENTTILVGSSISTNQTALSYRLVRVQDYPALAYDNKQLDTCWVTQISIAFDTNNGRSAALIDRSGWGVTVNADAICLVPGDDAGTQMNLAARYDPLLGSDEPGVGVFKAVYYINPGLLWAQTLLLGFWAETVTAITEQTLQQADDTDSALPQFNLSSGYITLERPKYDIRDKPFYSKGQYAFFDSNSDVYKGNFSSTNKTSYEDLITDAPWPNIWAPTDRLAKAMFSAISADLGQLYRWYDDGGQETSLYSTMISNSDHLYHWTENLTQIWNASNVLYKDDLLGARLEMVPYTYITGDYPLGFSNSTIFAIYTCQVPHLKSGFNIFISILVADLVLLRVAWTLYNFIVTYLLNSRHPDANLCLGCLESGRNGDTGTGKHISIDADEDTGYHGRVIELDDFGMDRKEWSNPSSSQKLLNRKPVGG
jgi:hypothetical protein